MKENSSSLFKQGLKDGLPIGLGYFPLAVTLGVNAVTGGFKAIESIAMGALSFTGVGQMTGMALMLENATYLSFFVALLVINLRNIVLSLSLSQRLNSDIPVWKRLLISLGNTDEIFALTIRREGVIPTNYFLGVMTIPYISWTLGEVVGCFATALVPGDVCVAMGMALYAMLVAAIVPAVKKSRPVLFAAGLSGVISFILQGIAPINQALINMFGKSVSSWVLVVGSLLSAAVAAAIWPVKESKGEDNE